MWYQYLDMTREHSDPRDLSVQGDATDCIFTATNSIHNAEQPLYLTPANALKVNADE